MTQESKNDERSFLKSHVPPLPKVTHTFLTPHGELVLLCVSTLPAIQFGYSDLEKVTNLF